MTPRHYMALVIHAGDDLLRPTPRPYLLDSDTLPDVEAAVYIVEGRDGTVLYVGSTRRPGASALRDRIAEHLREPAKAARWHRLYVLPLMADTSPEAVRLLEGLVALDLRPLDSGVHPRDWAR